MITAINNQTPNFSDSSQFGFELGFFISGLKISDDEKKAWVQILQQATPEQLVAMRESLEQAFLMEATKDADKVYEKKLRQLAQDFEHNQTKVEDDTTKKLAALEKELETKAGGILI